MNRRQWMIELFGLSALASLPAPARAVLFNESAEKFSRQYAQPTPNELPSLPTDHGPHPDFRNEWWYYTGWFESPTLSTPFGIQVTFFRTAPDIRTDNPNRLSPTELLIGHAALAIPAEKRLIHAEVVSRTGYIRNFVRGRTSPLTSSSLPAQDETTPALALQLGRWSLDTQEGQHWHCHIETDEFDMQWQAKQTQTPWLQGQGGFSQKGPKPNECSYYVTLPHLATQGTLRLKDQKHAFKGQFWMDHEWSSTYLAPNAAGWDWVGLLGNAGDAIMAFQIRAKDPKAPPVWLYAAHRDRYGKVTVYNTVRFETLKDWTSPRTKISYPVSQALHLDGTTYVLSPLFEDQELDSTNSTGNRYWEGAVTVTPQGQSEPWGRGYLELTGYGQAMQL